MKTKNSKNFFSKFDIEDIKMISFWLSGEDHIAKTVQ